MKRVLIILIEFIARLPISGYLRGKLYSLSPVKFIVPKDEKLKVFIGSDVLFDTLYPENIEIKNYTTLAAGCKVYTHYLDVNHDEPGFKFKKGKVKIGKATFLGANVIISNEVSIGDNVIVGSGSVITKDIPDNEIWAGNPAKFIKKRKLKNL